MLAFTKRLLSSARVQLTIAATTIAAQVNHAFAQDWAAPAVSTVESLQQGISSFLIPLVGVGIILYGGYSIVRGQFDIPRLLTVVAGGALVFFGDDMITALLNS